MACDAYGRVVFPGPGAVAGAEQDGVGQGLGYVAGRLLTLGYSTKGTKYGVIGKTQKKSQTAMLAWDRLLPVPAPSTLYFTH